MSNADDDVSDATLDKDFLSYLSLAESCVRNKDLRKCQKWFEKLCSKRYVDREAKKRRNAHLKRLIIAISKNQLVPPSDRELNLSPPNNGLNTKTGHQFLKSKQRKKKCVDSTRNLDRTSFDRKTYTVKKPLNMKNGICGRLSVTIGGKKTKFYDSDGNVPPQRSSKSRHSSDASSGTSEENVFAQDPDDCTKPRKKLSKLSPENSSDVSFRAKSEQRPRSRSVCSGSVTNAKNVRPGVTFTESVDKSPDLSAKNLTGNDMNPYSLHPTPAYYFQYETGNAFEGRENISQNSKARLFQKPIESIQTDNQPEVAMTETQPDFLFPAEGGFDEKVNDASHQEKETSFFEENTASRGENWNLKSINACARSKYFKHTTENNQNESDDIFYKKLSCLFEETPEPMKVGSKPDIKPTSSYRYTVGRATGENADVFLMQDKPTGLFGKSVEPFIELAGGADQPDPPRSGKDAMDSKTGSECQTQQNQKGRCQTPAINESEGKTQYTGYRSVSGGNDKTSFPEENQEAEPSTSKTTKLNRIKSLLKDSFAPNRDVDKPQVNVENISLTTAYDEFCSKQPIEARNAVCDLYRTYPEAIVDKLLELWKREGQAVIEDYKEIHRQRIEEMKMQFKSDVDEKARKFQEEQKSLRRWRDCKVQLDQIMNDLTCSRGGEKEQKQLMEALRMEISEERTKLKDENELNSKLKVAILQLYQEKNNKCAEATAHKDELKIVSDRLLVELNNIFKYYQEQYTMLKKVI